MRRLILLCGGVMIAACGQSGDEQSNNQAASNAAAADKPKPAFCFFKDAETKDWKASRDKQGNIVVKGKAYRQDSRYQAVLGAAKISGTTAEISPTIQPNQSGYGAPDDWWDVTSTIAASAPVETVDVTCGAKTIAELKVAAKK